MITKVLSVNNLGQLNDALQATLSESFSPNLAILFSASKHDYIAIGQLFQTLDISLVGCSTAGEICDAAIIRESITVMLFEMDPTAFETVLLKHDERSTYQLAFDLGKQATSAFADPAIILLSGGITVDAEQMVSGVKDAVGRELPLYGGLAGDDLQMQSTWVFSENSASDGGMMALILDQAKIEVKGMATSGWEPIGRVNVVTHCEGNVLYQINNEPALDVLLRYFGFFDNTTRVGEPMSTINVQYPLQIMREEGYNVLRSPLIANEVDRSLILAGGIKEGDQFRFSIAPGFEVIDQTIDNFRAFSQTSSDADALILFSCAGRYTALGPLLDDEVKGIFQQWQKPMIGFLTYGEIGNTIGGNCEFHNETCALVTLKAR